MKVKLINLFNMEISENNSKNSNDFAQVPNSNIRQEKLFSRKHFSWALLLIGAACFLAIAVVTLYTLKPDALKNLWDSSLQVGNKTTDDNSSVDNTIEDSVIRKEYILYQQNFKGVANPMYKVSFDASKDYEITMNEDLRTEITVKNPNFELKIFTLAGGDPSLRWFNDESEPETVSLATQFLGNLIRVKSPYYMTYHYTNGYETVAKGGCKGYGPSIDTIKACDTGQIVLKSGEENIVVVSVGCTAEGLTNVTFCDDIVKSLKVEKTEN